MRMMKALLLAALLGTLLVVARGEAAPSRSAYDNLIPRGWTEAAPRPGAHEHRFVSPAGDAWLALFGRPATDPVKAHLAKLSTVRDGRITYRREGPTWIVVSGYKGDRIFYRRATLACGGRAWHYLELEYPAAKKAAFDRLVTRASLALAGFAQNGCKG